MRTNHLLPYLSLFTLILFFSCSKDDDPEEQQIMDRPIVGEWVLTDFFITNPADFNSDGVFTTDVLSELTCYSINLNVRNNGTFSENSTNITVQFNSNGQIIMGDCTQTFNSSGTWELNGDQFAQYYSYLDSTIVRRVTISGDVLTRYGRDSPPIFGDLQHIFTRN